MDDSRDIAVNDGQWGRMIRVDESDLLKLRDALKMNVEFHANRDRMNGAVHLAREVRYSPLTSETMSAYDRVVALLIESQPLKSTE